MLKSLFLYRWTKQNKTKTKYIKERSHLVQWPGCELDDTGFEAGEGGGGGQDMFIFSTMSRPNMGHGQPPIQWVPVIKRPGREVNHSTQSKAKVKNEWSYTSTSFIHLQGVDRDNFMQAYILISWS